MLWSSSWERQSTDRNVELESKVIFRTTPTHLEIVITANLTTSLTLHGGNGSDCLLCPLPLPWCPWNAPVEIYNFFIGCPFPKRKCLGALALSKTKHTGLLLYRISTMQSLNPTYCTLFFIPGTLYLHQAAETATPAINSPESWTLCLTSITTLTLRNGSSSRSNYQSLSSLSNQHQAFS